MYNNIIKYLILENRIKTSVLNHLYNLHKTELLFWGLFVQNVENVQKCLTMFFDFARISADNKRDCLSGCD